MTQAPAMDNRKVGSSAKMVVYKNCKQDIKAYELAGRSKERVQQFQVGYRVVKLDRLLTSKINVHKGNLFFVN